MASPVPPLADHRLQGRPGVLPLGPQRARRLALLLACTALVAPGFALAQVPALPQGGQFVAGQGSIGAASGNALTITQTSARGVIDWRSFNIGQGASVTFNNGAGATLNRVTGGDLSQILGSLRATGSLYLVNPQGVVIGSSGVVVTGGRFVASSLDVANDAFMAGGTLVFRGSTEHAEVRNLGNIASTGGDVILISRAVRNEGTITAPRGTAALAAGTEVLLREGPEGHRGMVRVSGASGDVTNAGRIEAAQAELRAAGGNIYALAGNTAGVIRATGTETRNGRVWLSAGAGTNTGNVVTEGRIEARNADGTGGKVSVRAGNAVLNTGTIAAEGSSGGAVRVRAARVVQQGTISARGTSGAGGTLRLLAEDIALTGAQVEASGATGGGVVRIGGGYQGGEGLPRASTVAADAATTIRADATQRGTGGDVVVWSDNRTDFAGAISARGGAEGGNGGQAEVSSRGVLNYTGNTDLRAPLGAWGTLLLDPYNITISTGTQTTGSGFTANADDSVINAGDLVRALGLANVTVSTGLTGSAGTQDGDITVAVPLAWTTGGILTLEANRNIKLDAAISAPSVPGRVGGLILNAGGTITSNANASINVGRFVLSNGQWVQTGPVLPGFVAGDFQIGSGTRGSGTGFLRATGGSGTSTNPWLLTDIYGVQGMATLLTSHFRLANDIEAAGTTNWNDGAGFRPIGNATTRFAGSLDGAGHVITGLTINRPAEANVGLFGSINDATIQNLGLLGGSVIGQNAVGGVVGSTGTTSGSRLSGLFNTGSVTGSGSGQLVGGLAGAIRASVERSYATGPVSGTTQVGGLIGRLIGSVTESYATGNVTVQNNHAGGLVGLLANAGSRITNSYATGSVRARTTVGGLVGSANNNTQIVGSYASGAVSATATTTPVMGGLVGDNGATITSSFWDTQTTGRTSAVGAGAGTVSATPLGGTNQPSARSWTPYENAGWSTANWFQTGDMRPILRSELAAPVNGVTTIRNANQLQLMATNPAGSYRLGNDIIATATNAAASSAGVWGAGGFVPVGTSAAPFTGNLDGAGRVVSGLTINRSALNDAGLFGATASGSTISNIGLLGGSVTGSSRIGALVGDSRSTITRAFATGAVAGSASVGGLVGVNRGTITQAYATGAVGGTGASGVGGLVGDNRGAISQAYATGMVSGSSSLGGLVGDNSGTIAASFWDTTTTGRMDGVGVGSADGAFGRTTAQLQNLNTFRTTYAGPGFAWDFDTVWSPPNQIGQGNGSGPGSGIGNYPQLYAVSTVAAAFVNDQTRVYGDANPTSGTRIAGLRAGDSVSTPTTLTSGATMASPIGTYALDGSGTAIASPAGNVYRIVHVPGTLTITPRPIEVTADAKSRFYGDANPALTVQIGGRGLANNDSLTGALATDAMQNSPVGPYAITQGTLSASSNYDLTFVGNTLSITPRPITVTADAQSRVYGDANPALTYRVTRAGGGPALANGDTLSGALLTTATTTTPVGTVAITRGNLGATNTNYAITFNEGRFTIHPRSITVSADARRREYGEANPTLTYRVTRAGGRPALVNGDTLSGALFTTATTTTSIGTFPITRGSLGATDTNYAITFDGNFLTIAPRQITVSADAQSREYGDANPALTYRVTRAGSGPALVHGNTLSGALFTTASTTTRVSTVAITRGSLGAADINYTITFHGNHLTIAPRQITVSADARSREYGEANPTLTYRVTRADGRPALVNGNTLSGSLFTTATTTTPVGPVAITRGNLGATDSNYAIAFNGNFLTITPRQITVSANAQSRVHGAANPTLTFRVTRAGGGPALVNGNTLSGALSTAATTTTPVGTFAITRGSLGATDTNYAITFNGNNLIITPRPVTLAGSLVHDGSTDIASAAFGVANLVANDTLSITGAGSVASPHIAPGAQALAFGTLSLGEASASNYTLMAGTSTATIAACPLTIAADPLSCVYGDANPALTYRIGGRGLVPGDSLSVALATDALQDSTVGPYVITKGDLGASSNDDLTFVGNTLAIGPATLVATAEDARRRQWQPNLVFTFRTTGLTVGDTAAVICCGSGFPVQQN